MRTTAVSPAMSPSRSPRFASPIPAEAPKESAVARLLIAPLTFVSFLLSLALIDARNHRLRGHEHSQPRPAPIGVYQNIKYYTHLMVYKPVPKSPYEYVKSPSLVPEAVSKGMPKDGAQEKEPWHWHAKQRHMMKAEMEEAFRVRKWVVILLFITGGIWVLAVGMLWRWMGYLLGHSGR